MIEVFTYQDTHVRTLTVNDEPAFIANDLCAVLDIGNSRQALSYLDDDEKGVTTNDTLGGVQRMAYVTESGMYSLVLRSRKPEAKAFKRWVTHEVLPSIRKHGMYATEQTVETLLSNPDTAIKLLETIKEERAKNAELEAKREADKPKVVFADAVAASQSCILVGDLAKILRGNGVDIGGKRLFEWLRENGYLIRRQGTDRNMPTQYSMDRGLFEIKETAVTHSDGHVTISKTPKVTGKGQRYFVGKFLGEQLAVLEA